MKINNLLLPALMLMSQSAWSAPELYKGNDLLKSCQAYASDTGDKAVAGTCAGFIMGMVDMHDMLVSKGLIIEQWCTPKDVTLDQLIQATLDYMVTQPDKLDAGAASMVANALYKTFHCR